MKEIICTQGKIAVVDDENFEELNRFRWQAVKMKNLWYARTTLVFPDRAPFVCHMHWAVLKLKPTRGFVIDHIDGDGLHDWKDNLRIVTYRQNCQNKHNTLSSKYPGVSFHKLTGKWIAHARIGDVTKHLGSFTTEEEAFKRYKHAVSICGQTVLYEKGDSI